MNLDMPLLEPCTFFQYQVVRDAIDTAHNREAIPMDSAGVSLFIFFPSAFVAFPSAPVGLLPAMARARITAAGAFHNWIFWCALLFAVRIGLGTIATTLTGYEDISSLGVIVTAVDVVRSYDYF